MILPLMYAYLSVEHTSSRSIANKYNRLTELCEIGSISRAYCNNPTPSEYKSIDMEGPHTHISSNIDNAVISQHQVIGEMSQSNNEFD